MITKIHYYHYYCYLYNIVSTIYSFLFDMYCCSSPQSIVMLPDFL